MSEVLSHVLDSAERLVKVIPYLALKYFSHVIPMFGFEYVQLHCNNNIVLFRVINTVLLSLAV